MYTIEEHLADLERILCCPDCRGVLHIGHSDWRCSSCDHQQPVWKKSVLLDQRLDGVAVRGDPDYPSQTKHRYQSEEYATEYRERYKRSLYSKVIADRERSCVQAALRRTGPNHAVLDLPAGTGKLAPVHQQFSHRVIAADVSAQMLLLGLNMDWQDCKNLVGVVQADVTRIAVQSRGVDCAICLRLMHRLPVEILRTALEELARVSRHWMIVSNGVNSASLARFTRGRNCPGRANLSRTDWQSIMSDYGEIVQEWSVLPGVSTEVITLLKVKSNASGA